MKFKVGEKVRIKRDLKENKLYGEWVAIESMVKYKGKVVTIKYVTKKEYGIEEMGCLWTDEMFEKKEDSMTKYEELKSRIEALDNGWDKEADDILNEIKDSLDEGRHICISFFSTNGALEIQNNHRYKIVSFNYGTQCEKLSAFKQALMWLLDHSNIKKDIVGEEVKAEIEGKIYKVKVLKRDE